METLADIHFAVTTPMTLPTPAERIKSGRRDAIAAGLRERAEEIRSAARGADTGNGWGEHSLLLRTKFDKAAGFDHLALLVEHHDAFPNVSEDAMPPSEFAKLKPRAALRSLGACALVDAAG